MLDHPALDLTRYHFRQQHGDVTVFGTWWLGEDSGPSPCLVLIPTRERPGMVPCCVPLNHAWVWSEEIGNPVFAARMALAMANSLGLGATPSNAIRVRSIVVDHLDDLIKLPPMPDSMRPRVVIGEAKVTAREHGQVVRHHEVIERV